MCLLRFYEAQPCEVMEQPQKPANKINHGDMQGKDLDNRISYCYAQYIALKKISLQKA